MFEVEALCAAFLRDRLRGLYLRKWGDNQADPPAMQSSTFDSSNQTGSVRWVGTGIGSGRPGARRIAPSESCEDGPQSIRRPGPLSLAAYGRDKRLWRRFDGGKSLCLHKAMLYPMPSESKTYSPSSMRRHKKEQPLRSALWVDFQIRLLWSARLDGKTNLSKTALHPVRYRALR